MMFASPVSTVAVERTFLPVNSDISYLHTQNHCWFGLLNIKLIYRSNQFLTVQRTQTWTMNVLKRNLLYSRCDYT